MKRSKSRQRKARTERRGLGARHGAGATPSPGPAPSDRQAAPPAEGLPRSAGTLLPYDEHLLERSLTQWQVGDWGSLALIASSALEHHPDRAQLALLVAAAHFHHADAPAVREFVGLAQAWGCSRDLVSRILIAGVHNTLGRAAAAAGEGSRALAHFEPAIATVTPGSEARVITQTRVLRQLEQIEQAEWGGKAERIVE